MNSHEGDAAIEAAYNQDRLRDYLSARERALPIFRTLMESRTEELTVPQDPPRSTVIFDPELVKIVYGGIRGLQKQLKSDGVLK